jgi:hypothetical protein
MMKKIFCVVAGLLIPFAAYSSFKAITYEKFPAIEFKTMTDTIISLPDRNYPPIVLAILSFTRPEEGVVESWSNSASALFRNSSKFNYYQAAIVGGAGPIEFFIYNGMKSGANEEQKKHLIVCFGDKDGIKKSLNITDDSLIYTYLIDRDGNILWKTKGKIATHADIKELIANIKKQLKK